MGRYNTHEQQRRQKEQQIVSTPSNKQDPQKPNYVGLGMSLGLVLGVPLGVCFGLALGNMAFMSIGIAAGMSIGLAIGASLEKGANEKDA
jgi:predicted MFS family arabinose efflux permease